MSTIRPSYRTFADWLRPIDVLCGFVLLVVLSSHSVNAQETPVDRPWDAATAEPAAVERTSEIIRRESGTDVSIDGVKVVANKMSVDLTERFSKVLEFRDNLIRVDGHDPQVIDVSPLEPNKLRIRGVGQGVTTMIVTDFNKQTYVIEVFVSGDARLLQSVLKRTFPESAIECKALKGDTVLLTGWISDNQTISRIIEVAQTYSAVVINHMRVGGPQEVQLRVKIIEVQRSKLRTFGINFKASTLSSVIASTPGPITPISGLINPMGGAPGLTLTPSSGNPPSLTAGFNGNRFAFDFFLQALKEEGLLKVFTEPVIVTRNGEAAELDDGGEFPIPVPGGLGTVTIEFREFGVILKTLPIVVSPTRVKQQVSAEVSEKDLSNAISLNGTTVPGITKRKIQSTVEMNFGDTMVLGGLISTRTVGNTFKTPLLGEIPGIGAAFRKVIYQQSETEMIILITPEFGSSVPADQIPPGGPGTTTTAPTDRELYKGGLIEVPKYGPDCGPDCRTNCPQRFYGDGHSYDSGTSSGPTITPSATPSSSSIPVPSGLIGPPGARSSDSIPPAPAADHSLSNRNSNRSNWPAKTRTNTSAKNREIDPFAETDAIKAASFNRSAKTDRTRDKRTTDERRDERDIRRSE